MKTAKAAVFAAINGPFEIKEYPITEPGEGMARMKLIASGICGTDVHIHTGRIGIAPPKVIGHEFIGKVEALGSASDSIKVGDNVIVDIACPCGECPLCKAGDDANCINLGVTNGGDPEQAPHFWGGYGEYNYSPIKNLVKIPDDLDPKTVAVYACAGPTAIHAISLAQKANCHLENANVAVVQGLGPVGSFAVAYLASLGIKHVVALTAGNDTAREAVALKLGATEVFNLTRTPIEDITKQIRELNGGIGADVVFEASGAAQAVPQGMNMLRNRGTYIVPGQYSDRGPVPILPQLITFNALHLIGSSQYSLCDVASYIDFLHANANLKPVIDSLITEYKVEDINKAFEDIRQGKNIKSMLVL